MNFAKLAHDADDIIRRCISYTKCEIIWDATTASHLAMVENWDGVPCCMPAETIVEWMNQCRGDIQQRMIDHIRSEISQDSYSQHGSRSSYSMGCRGLLCRRAHREALRPAQGTKRSPKYAAADELLEEVVKIFEERGASLTQFLSNDKVASL